jgi:stage IV sporulation protein A
MEIGVRLIDCVGFMVEGAAGHIEDDAERLVKTPWYDYEIPFTKAAEIGTEKVIRDHSTVGIIVTTDGSFGELPRENYLAAERKTVEELKSLGKPFLVLMNTVRPFSQETTALTAQLEKNYGVRVIPVNCEQLKKEDIERILKNLLLEFPVAQIEFSIPKWAELLPTGHWLKDELLKQASQALNDLIQMKDVDTYCRNYAGMVMPDMMVQDVKCTWMDMSNGHVQLELVLEPKRYFQIISEFAGARIDNEYQLIQSLKEMMITKREYDSIRNALEAVRAKGYGVVMPRRSEITLSEPELIRHGNRFGVKMKAYAPSISFIRASIETEIAPIVGDESQANDLMNYIRENSADGNDGVWNTSIFGKSIEQTVVDGMQAKVQQITEDCQQKLQDTMQKIINDSDGGMICIII